MPKVPTRRARLRGAAPRMGDGLPQPNRTAVDQAALDPEAALRRNGEAVGAIAAACREMKATA